MNSLLVVVFFKSLHEIYKKLVPDLTAWLLFSRMGECYETVLATPHILLCTLNEPKSAKKVFECISNHPSFELKVFLLPTALPQGKLTEVPLKFNFSHIKVVGQTI